MMVNRTTEVYTCSFNSPHVHYTVPSRCFSSFLSFHHLFCSFISQFHSLCWFGIIKRPPCMADKNGQATVMCLALGHWTHWWFCSFIYCIHFYSLCLVYVFTLSLAQKASFVFIIINNIMIDKAQFMDFFKLSEFPLLRFWFDKYIADAFLEQLWMHFVCFSCKCVYLCCCMICRKMHYELPSLKQYWWLMIDWKYYNIQLLMHGRPELPKWK